MQLKTRGQMVYILNSSLQSDIVDRMLMGESADEVRSQYDDSAFTDNSPTLLSTKSRHRQSTKRGDEEVVELDEGSSQASQLQAMGGAQHGQLDPALLQIAHRLTAIAHDHDFNRAYPLSAELIRELVCLAPMRPSTPNILAVLRDIWGQIQPLNSD